MIEKNREPLKMGEEVLVLSESMRKKDWTGKFYKASTENRPHFNHNISNKVKKKFRWKIFLLDKKI